MEFTKYFCRLITETELDNDDVAEYYDIVQSIVPPKLVVAYGEDDMVEANVLVYTGQNDSFIYEIVLKENVDLDEGEQISDELAEAFDFDFELESGLEI